MPVRPPTFRPKGQRTRTQVNADYDRRRGSASDRLYDARWSKASLAFRRMHPLCLGCEAVGRVEPATLTDHVIPHRGNAAIFWDQSRWQACCAAHHNIVKQRLEDMLRQGRATPPDLWLNSEKAKKITIELLGGGGGSKL